MSERLIYAWLADTPVHLDDAQAENQPQLLWKVVLRTGTWKLRPGPGGVKLEQPLKIFRDKAPKGHISMAELKQNFEAGAKEHVTVPSVHADGTTSDGGFVKKLVIQDVPGEDGSKPKESLLWAGMEITDSELKKKLDERSIRGVSGGILFDYQRTEDAKKFDQILSHVMVTNSPWINGTGDFTDKLPEGVMAGESDDLPIGEVEFSGRETDPQPQLPAVQMEDPPAAPTRTPGKVLWKPEQGFRFAQDSVQKALEDWRNSLMASMPESQRYTLDWPYFSVDDVSLSGDGGNALICSGYGPNKDTWVANFKVDADSTIAIDPFAQWTPAKQEWVAASEQVPTSPAGRGGRPPVRRRGPDASSPLNHLGLREAQAIRTERSRLGTPSSTTGGPMGRLDDLLNRDDLQLSEEDREILLSESQRLHRLEETEAQRRARERLAEVTAYCGEVKHDGTVVGGKLDDIGLGDPGVKKYVRNALLSDDGGPAIELSVHLEDGSKTEGQPKTATELLKGFIDILPKTDEGRVSLAQQARRVPDDPKPPEGKPEDGGELDLSMEAVRKRSDEFAAASMAAGFDLGIKTEGGS